MKYFKRYKIYKSSKKKSHFELFNFIYRWVKIWGSKKLNEKKVFKAKLTKKKKKKISIKLKVVIIIIKKEVKQIKNCLKKSDCNLDN